MSVKIHATNGVSYGMTHTVTAAEDTAGEVIFEIPGVGTGAYPIVATFTVTNASGVNIPLADAVITYPEDGQVSIADGAATFVVTAGHIISVIVQRDNATVTY